MEIILKSLHLMNFKGIRNLEINFSPKATNIYGANNSGKTSVMDAFYWLLFGKNNEGKATESFNVKTLDINRNFIPKLEHSVEAVLIIDGTETSFKRTLKQKWVKPKGKYEQEYQGDKGDFSIDGIPFDKGPYEQKISEIIDIETFRQVTDAMHFNKLHWKEQREVLIKLSPSITNENIAKESPELEELVSLLGKNTIIEFAKKTNSEIKDLQKKLNEIPARISEQQMSIPKPVNVEELVLKKTELNTELSELDDRLTDCTSAFADYKKEQSKIFELEANLRELKNTLFNDFKDKKNAKENSLKDIKRKLSAVRIERDLDKEEIVSLKNRSEKLNTELNQLRATATEQQKEVFVLDEDALMCPTCKRLLDNTESIKEDLVSSFNENKSSAYKEIKAKGEAIKTEIAKVKDSIAENEILVEISNKQLVELENEIKTLEAEISSMEQPDVSENNEYIKLSEKIDKLKENLKPPGETESVGNIKARKSEINIELDDVKEKLASVGEKDRIDKRIEELLNEEKKLSIEKAKKERLVNLCELFEKEKMLKLEESVNSMFKLAKFSLFDRQKNGGESLACTALCNGVPYIDVNHASKVNLGLDIINALCKFHKINAPVFIDNRESVTEIIDCGSQIINLIVSAEDKELRVEAI